MRLSTPYLNKSIKKALAFRVKILKKSISDKSAVSKLDKDNHPFGGDVKMVREHKLQCRLLTTSEQDEAIEKYKQGMTMMAIAAVYGCHYTTIGRLLRKRGCTIRE